MTGAGSSDGNSGLLAPWAGATQVERIRNRVKSLKKKSARPHGWNPQAGPPVAEGLIQVAAFGQGVSFQTTRAQPNVR